MRRERVCVMLYMCSAPRASAEYPLRSVPEGWVASCVSVGPTVLRAKKVCFLLWGMSETSRILVADPKHSLGGAGGGASTAGAARPREARYR